MSGLSLFKIFAFSCFYPNFTKYLSDPYPRKSETLAYITVFSCKKKPPQFYRKHHIRTCNAWCITISPTFGRKFGSSIASMRKQFWHKRFITFMIGFVFQTIRVLFLWFIFLHIFQSNTKGYIDTKRNKKYLYLLISPCYMYMYYSFIHHTEYSSCLVTQYCYYYQLYKKYMLKQPLNL